MRGASHKLLEAMLTLNSNRQFDWFRPPHDLAAGIDHSIEPVGLASGRVWEHNHHYTVLLRSVFAMTTIELTPAGLE